MSLNAAMSFYFSSANLSESYFRNRQDRCIVIYNSSTSNLGDFLEDLVHRVQDFSFHLQSDYTVELPQNIDRFTPISRVFLLYHCSVQLLRNHRFKHVFLRYFIIGFHCLFNTQKTHVLYLLCNL